MNWKFWTWPAQIRQLRANLEYQTKLTEEWHQRAAAASSRPSPLAPRLPLWSAPYDVEPLRRRLAQLPPDDPLHALLLGYVDAAIVNHAGLKIAPDMANQLAGKLNALDELRSDFAHLWHQAHQPPKEEKK